ncbi:MAG TPA: glycosyl hydrolase family 18 protein [Gaiellaceae bacterium]|nr:glycosyl hydrolase family 18 protein [Gaiellaceae bacterium]
MRAALAVVVAAFATHASSAPRLQVLGFQSDYSPSSLVDRNAHALTMVGVDGINLTGRGAVSGPSQDARAQLARARADHLPAVLLLGNWSERMNDFSEPLAYKTLGSPAAVSAAAVAVAKAARGWDGVSIDLESLAPRDRSGLRAFVADLRGDLPNEMTLTICLEAFTSTASYAANGYDLHAIAGNVNEVVLMTYDDHGTWSTPGPVGPLAWQRASVAALERVVPRRQIFLGAADYGYDWHPNNFLTVTQARALVRRSHGTPHWVAAAGEWTAKLHDGTTIWWSDARSVALRLALARKLGLYGAAIWSLGTGDPIPSSS